MKTFCFLFILLLSAPVFLFSAPTDLHLTSPAFEEGKEIPSLYTCEGQNISPPLWWGSLPAGTQRVAVIAEDPDAPNGVWTHWVIYNLPPTIDSVPENLPPIEKLANSEHQGVNSSGKIGYEGPCPPSGSHRYYFRLYALDTDLQLSRGVSKEDLLKAMQGHILGKAELMGRYQKKKPVRS